MSQYRITDRALADLDEIWLYIAQDNVTAADELSADFISKFRLLGKFPEIGPARDELMPNIRSFPVDDYLIFYRRFENGVEIIRIIHGAQDLASIFDW